MNAAELHDLWGVRDRRYALRRVDGMVQPVSRRELDIIRWWRGNEADGLDDPVTARMAGIEARTWAPPQPSAHRGTA